VRLTIRTGGEWNYYPTTLLTQMLLLIRMQWGFQARHKLPLPSRCLESSPYKLVYTK
jgi:hypothetical protein